MLCVECQQELSGPVGGYANASDWATLHESGCCSERCAILKNLSLICAIDKSALLPLLANVVESPSKVRFKLEDILTRLKQVRGDA